MPTTPDHYATLGVSPTAVAKDIKAAYRALAKKLHPDVGGDAAALARVNQAADVLLDVKQREAYDRERTKGASAGPAASKRNAPPKAPDAPPPKKKTVALCPFCDAINKVDGDPRYYPANCSACSRPLGGKPAPKPEPEPAPTKASDDGDIQVPVTHVRCPSCAMRVRIEPYQGQQELVCGGCGTKFVPAETKPDEDNLGKFFADVVGTVLGETAKGIKHVEEQLGALNENLRKRTDSK